MRHFECYDFCPPGNSLFEVRVRSRCFVLSGVLECTELPILISKFGRKSLSSRDNMR